MPHEYLYWFSQKHIDEIVTFLWAFLFFDTSRYALLKIVVVVLDIIKLLFGKRRPACTYCPSVSVLLSGYNEDAIGSTLESVWGTYPKLEIIVVDDGSTDSTYQIIKDFAETHPGIIVLQRKKRGGKASAMNYAFNFASGEVIVVIDADSTLEKNAIWELVQPLKDPAVGAVSGNLLPRNMFCNYITWCQAYEYLHSIFVGRLVSAKLDILGIVSGAFGAFRREVWIECGGNDVGPPEDLDFTVNIRRAGYGVAFTQYATCYTDVPDTLASLNKQRLRWEQGGVVRVHCRKHIGMANIFSKNFRLTNLFVWLESLYYDLISPYVIFAYYVWLMFYVPPYDLIYVLGWLYGIYFCFDLIQIAVCMFYSQNIKRDLGICLIMPLMFIYRTYMVGIRALGNTQELLWRQSYESDYVPKHVRDATWHY